jgi:hypothetical protein
MKTHWWSAGIAPRFLDRGVWSVSFPDLYLRGNTPRYPLDKRFSGPQSRSGRGGVEENILTLPLLGIEPRYFRSSKPTN